MSFGLASSRGSGKEGSSSRTTSAAVEDKEGNMEEVVETDDAIMLGVVRLLIGGE
jgi:hypothetical protein